ncbi:MAG TPA: DNA alkylation repair protein [Microbacteriaceae bacterium]|nr:DNA alkylation repair protein [Microbacteriaceae bacterium]
MARSSTRPPHSPESIAAAKIRARLRVAADPERAAGAQAYMKSAMPYYGVRVPDVRRIARVAGSDLDLQGALAVAAELWDGATHREERYAAIGMLRLRPVRGRLEAAALIERFAVEGAWWDLVDELSHCVAELHDAHPIETRDLVLRWSVDPWLWLRRLAIISQLGRKDRVDLELLSTVIEPNLDAPEFFIRKAIGWALREVARLQPDWVIAFAATHSLSPLTRREALKHLA